MFSKTVYNNNLIHNSNGVAILVAILKKISFQDQTFIKFGGMSFVLNTLSAARIFNLI